MVRQCLRIALGTLLIASPRAMLPKFHIDSFTWKKIGGLENERNL